MTTCHGVGWPIGDCGTTISRRATVVMPSFSVAPGGSARLPRDRIMGESGAADSSTHRLLTRVNCPSG